MRNKEGFVWGVILVLAGLVFLAFQVFPGITDLFSWPWILVGLGAIFFVFGLATRTGGLLIPASILTTLGGIFLWQTATDNWESWAYVWTLMPGSVAVGMLLGGLFDPELRQARPVAIWMLLFSLLGFAIFGGAFGLSPSLVRFWPVILILVGAWILLKGLMRPSEREKSF